MRLLGTWNQRQVIEVETLRETQEEVETGGVRVTKGFRGVVLHCICSVLLCSDTAAS